MTDFVGPASSLNAVTSRPSDGRNWGPALTWFKNCTSSSTQDGTEVDAGWLNQVTGFFRNVIGAPGLKADGVTPVVAVDQSDNMVLNGIQQLIQRGQSNYAVDTGTADALLATPAVALAEYKAGMRLLVLKNPTVGANATATPTVNFGLGNLTIVKDDASALAAGDLKKGGIFEVELDGAGNARLTGLLTISDVLALIAANAVVPATANVTLYVSTASATPPGNDATADGTAAKPFATIGAAASYGAKRYSFVGYSLIVQLAVPGTYAAPGFLPIVGGSLVIQGDTTGSNQAGYIISGAGSASYLGLVTVSGGSVLLSGVTIQNTGNICSNVAAGTTGQLSLKNVSFTTSSQSTPSLILASAGGSVQISSGCVMAGGAQNMWLASAGTITMIANVAISGTYIYPGATVAVNTNGNLVLASSSLTFTGTYTVTGPRYSVALNGVINTGGNGANFFPGNSAGTAATGGQYA